MKIREKIRTILARILSEELFAQINFNYLRMKMGKMPVLLDLNSPRRFSEKMLWLKLNHRVPGASDLADKLRVRHIVEERVGDKVLIPLLGVFTDPAQIDFDKLPQRFVLKPNHGSGMIMFCDKSCLDKRDVVRRCLEWLDVDYGLISQEYQYKNISRCIVAEADLKFLFNLDDLVDYKFFCFNGMPRYVQVDVDRFSYHRRVFFDADWRKQEFGLLYPTADIAIQKPLAFDLMKDIAAKLSEGLSFARIDLYFCANEIFFGEITLHPEGGVGPFSPDSADRMLGDLLELPYA